MSFQKLDIVPLLHNPLSKADDLGKLIPSTEHGISVCLPTWQDTIDYEKHESRVINALHGGYPRFVIPAASQRFFNAMRDRYGKTGDDCQVYPSSAAAQRCAEFIRKQSGADVRVQPTDLNTWTVFFEASGCEAAKSYWCHSGEGILSRQAAAILENRPPVDAVESLQLIRQRRAAIHRIDPSQVFVFPNGMAAIWTVMRFFQLNRPGTESIQFGFPYVDTLKLQEKTGSGHRFFPMGNSEDIHRVRRLVQADTYSALFCEAPSNPLLISADIPGLSAILRHSSTPFVVDDTLAACGNLDILPHCDVLATSLTKYFSGIGDVMGGALVVNRTSPWAEAFLNFLQTDDHSDIWCEDAMQLELNSRDFQTRVGTINCNAETLADYLHRHPAIKAVYYPKYTNRDEYNRIRRPLGGFGGLLSFTLKQEKRAEEVFDVLQVNKGPNLGMEYTLACPFTLLAHYHELAFVERCGLSPWLIRVSVGLEPTDELIGRFCDALAVI
ncbi:hypothetical protein BVX99_01580 [bacterium F16]|nr:hypothetical protein BVX99_01580 [bacterium F16]